MLKKNGLVGEILAVMGVWTLQAATVPESVTKARVHAEKAVLNHRGTMGAESVTALRADAKKGDAKAQFTLSMGHYWGYGVKKDLKEALRWLRLAAEQGYAEAQFFLGWLYTSGNGGEINHKEAIQWFRKAAEQGYPDAQFALGLPYEEGVGGGAEFCRGVQMDSQSRGAGTARCAACAGRARRMNPSRLSLDFIVTTSEKRRRR